MNLENKHNIDEVINHFTASNNGKIDDPVFNNLIEMPVKNLPYKGSVLNILSKTQVGFVYAIAISLGTVKYLGVGT